MSNQTEPDREQEPAGMGHLSRRAVIASVIVAPFSRAQAAEPTPVKRGVPSVAVTGYAYPGMGRDFEDAQTQNDPKRWDDFVGLQRRAMTDLPLIRSMEMRFVTVTSKRLMNHTVTADGVVGGNFASVLFALAA